MLVRTAFVKGDATRGSEMACGRRGVKSWRFGSALYVAVTWHKLSPNLCESGQQIGLDGPK
jgi:hypothetical protein